ncbi:MAG: cadherin repeat domain-containing protein, partial [Candidatus Atribacteria bacterium]|nr:cadherin repeat domain-containing protein [Candidatus Atribacteria bacterium]
MRTTLPAARESRPLLEALEPRILLDGTPEEQALELLIAGPALYAENQDPWADEFSGVGTGGAASDAGPLGPPAAPGDMIDVELLGQWGGLVSDSAVVGDYAYVCRGLAPDILDIRDPSQPVAAVASPVSILGSAAPLFADSVWTGAGSTPNWSDAANWNTGTVPQPADSVIFDVTSVGESRIDADFGGTIASITINGYAGRIWQERSLTITADYSQSSGQFISTPNFPFSVGNSFSVSAPGAGMFGRTTGTGDVNNPVLIYDVYGLQCLHNGAALYYKLNNDIDASVTINWRQGIPGREGFSPIGGTTDSMFYHSVDGDGHAIANLFINITDLSQTNVGLLGYNMSTVENLGLVNCSITGPGYTQSTGATYTGSIAGYNYGTISNCYSTGSISNQSYAGGLARRNGGKISECYNTGDISGTTAGGLAGHNYNSGEISDCHNTGNISGDYAGGLVGNYNYGAISSSCNSGSVSSALFAGGLVVWNTGSISDCYNTGSVSQTGPPEPGTGYIGGLVGRNHLGTIKNSYNAGRVSGDWQVGGVVGWDYKGKIYNSYNVGIVSESDGSDDFNVAKGFAGFRGNGTDKGIISNCGWWTGACRGSGVVGITYPEADRNAFANPNHGVYTNTVLNTFNPWDFSAIWDMYDGSSFPFFRWQVSFAPTDITLSGTSVAENQPVGTVVGVLSGTDPDPGQSETLVFTLEPGYGDNALFQINGNQLQTAAVFDYEARNSYSIMVQATDTGSPALTYDEPFTLNVIDLEEIAPDVVSVNLNSRPGR